MPRKILSLDRLKESGYQFQEIEDEEYHARRVDGKDLNEKIMKQLAIINQPDREIFMLFIEGYSQETIAKKVYRCQSSVSKSIKRTRRKVLINTHRE